MSVYVVVTAAGSGERLGAGIPKGLVEVQGQPLVAAAVAGVYAGCGEALAGVAVTHPETARSQFAAALAEFLDRPTAPTRLASGGSTRQESVYAGLRALQELGARPGDYALIHDAARAFTPPEVYARVVAALQGGARAVIPGLPVADTIKLEHDGRVADTLDRSHLVRVQTPQGFEWEGIWQAHTAAHAGGTNAALDDAALMEARGVEVAIVPGSERSLKVTTPWDLQLVSAWENAGPEPRG